MFGLEVFRVQGDIVKLEGRRVEGDRRGLFNYIKTDGLLASYYCY